MRTVSFIAVRLQVAILVLIGLSLASCGDSVILDGEAAEPVISSSTSVPTNTLSAAGEQTLQINSDLSVRYRFPSEIDPTRRYLFYLHGKIIEDQGLPAISSEYGEYKYEGILEALHSYGFVVISEQRSRDTDTAKYARRVATQVNDLLNAGIHPSSITVVGASKGAAIAVIVSNLVANAETNYVLLGACYPPLIDEWRHQGISLFGNVLAIYDSSDEYAVSCQPLFALSEDTGLSHHSEIVLGIGTGHGILYEPLEEWVLPTVQWANQEQ